MRVLQLSTSDLHGGAPRAAHRSHRALRARGVDSIMVVQDRRSDDPHVLAPRGTLAQLVGRYARPRFERASRGLYGARDVAFDGGWWPADTLARVSALGPDLVHTHWVCSGFLRIEDVPRFAVPWVCTLHDMWWLTGGCFYAAGCRGFEARCGHCPTLQSRRALDASRWGWRRKHRAYARSLPTLIAPSQWMADQARRSSLLSAARIEVIPNGIELDRFTALDRGEARRALGLPENASLVSFGAMWATDDPRKGFDLLEPAMRRVAAHATEPVELVVFGSAEPKRAPAMGMPTHYLGRISDDVTMARIHAAAGVFVLPSRDDNLPNTVVEALACGTPCVAFRVGGIPDLIDHHRNGALAPAFDPGALAEGVLWCLERSRRAGLRETARGTAVARYDLQRHAEQLQRLYEDVAASVRR